MLTFLCTGIRRSGKKNSRSRLPITISHLHAIKRQLSISSFLSHDKLLYWTAFTLAFYGILRASEYSCPSKSRYKQSRHLLLDDVDVTLNSLSIHLKSSKTDHFGEFSTLLIGSTGSSTCPVKAMHKFLVSRQLYSHGPLFTFSSGDFLTQSAISTTTKSLLSAAGIDPGAYSSHSYRIGAATAAAEAGLPDHLIKTLGRWRSTAYQSYIRTSPEVLLKAAKQITQAQ